MLIAGALAISTLLAACTASSSVADNDAVSAEEVAARYGYDEASATLSPVFALVPEYKDPKDGYARDLLAAKCLAGVVEYRVVPPGAQAGLFDDRTGQVNFNEQIAAQWGYPALHAPAAPDSAIPDGVTIGPDMQAAMQKCGEAADARLGKPPQRLLADVEDAGWQAVPASSEVQDAAAQWRDCMAPAGVIDLPEDPTGMPSASIGGAGSQLEDAQGDVGASAGSVASDREREVAVLDARCRDQARYDQAVLHARAEAELTALGRDIDGFEASRGAYEAYEKKLDEVITELG
ncbi:hypothetical protein ACGIF2_15135 [Cellulomonas sp. P22]|uniref:hypothetical protein n=1 Tax=Cellulomonas sp. P22 TaxID=3373189 RepID=UPI0037932AFA